ncbi:MAG TPA: hypothetical protein VFN18_07605 [Solirubrobacterales bacterium]|nr:hypothetical protein [Solirubrobacterales bacterium]
MDSPEQTEPTQPAVEETVDTGMPDDANDMRGYHFSRLMRTPLTLILVAALTAAAFVAGLVFVGALIGAGGALAALLLGIVVVFAIADKRAADDFFEVYAANRGLTLIHGRGRLPEATPLLRKGDDRYTDRTLTGPIAEGFDGTLALFTYEEETRDSDGDTQTNYYRYTLGLVEVPDCASFVPELYCQRKFGLRALEKFEDAFRGNKQRVALESEQLLDKYEIFANKEQDANWLRQLFSPTFIVWLADSAPDKFAFELVGGTLCCYVNGHKEKAADLDAIAAATGAVAKRLRDEALE